MTRTAALSLALLCLAACGPSKSPGDQDDRRAWTVVDGVASAVTVHPDRGTVDRLSIRCVWSDLDQRSTVDYELATTPPAGQQSMLDATDVREFATVTRITVEGASTPVLAPRRVRLGLQRLHLSERQEPGRRTFAVVLDDDLGPSGKLSEPDAALLGALSAGKAIRLAIGLGHDQTLTTAFTGQGAAQALTAAGCFPPPRARG